METKKKILYVTTSYPPVIGGAQIHLHQIAKAMNVAGADVQVITHWSRYRTDWLFGTTIFPGPMKKYRYEGVQVSQIGFPHSTRLAMLPWSLLYYLIMAVSVRRISKDMAPFFSELAGTPSLIHATRIGREFLVRTALEFSRKQGIPFVLTPNHHPKWRGQLYQEYDKIYREADAIFALTSAEKEMLVQEKGVAEEKIQVTGVGPVLSDGFSEEAFRSRFHLKDRFVLYLGQQYNYKGISAILKSAPLVWQRHPNVKFVFMGPHTQDSIKAFKNMSDDRILNFGTVDLETKTSALAACEFLCLPSLQESFGGIFVEAWSLRKAVIGGRIATISCVVDDGRDGLLCSQKPDELADVISYLLSRPTKCQEMGKAGWQKVQERYTWKEIINRTQAVYNRLCL